MQFKINHLILVGAISTLAAATPVPQNSEPVEGSLGCKIRAQACRFEIKSPECTTEWKTEVEGCMPASCIVDTLAQCPETIVGSAQNTSISTQVSPFGCEMRAKACRFQVKSPKCTTEWKTEVESCMPASCLIETFSDCSAISPRFNADSTGCNAMANACRIYIKSTPCTDAWKTEVQSCIPSGCNSTVEDILAQCPAPPTKRTTTAGCATMARSCRFQITAEKCSDEWKTEVQSCIPSGCSAILNETLSQCSAPASAKRTTTGCTAMANACRFQITAEVCSDEWKTQVQSCIPSGCDSVLTEILAQCPAASPAKGITTVGCAAMAKSCRFQITAEKCSDEWKTEVQSCIPSGCSAILNETLSQCSAPAPAKRTTTGCAAMVRACRFQITAEKCSAAWKQEVESCVPASCKDSRSSILAQCSA